MIRIAATLALALLLSGCGRATVGDAQLQAPLDLLIESRNQAEVNIGTMDLESRDRRELIEANNQVFREALAMLFSKEEADRDAAWEFLGNLLTNGFVTSIWAIAGP